MINLLFAVMAALFAIQALAAALLADGFIHSAATGVATLAWVWLARYFWRLYVSGR